MNRHTRGADLLAEEAVARVAGWLEAAGPLASGRDSAATRRLSGVVTDPPAAAFAMRFVDRVIRPEDPETAAGQLASLVAEARLPAFLSPLDRLLLRLGARLGPRMPRLVLPIAQRRMRALVGHLVVDSEPQRLSAHLGTRAAQGYSLNVSMLGEAVLGEAEARRRHTEVLDTLAQPDVVYVSVKVSAVVSQLNPWDFDGSLHRICEALRPLLRAAASASPATFINLDMEEYHDLELTVGAFRRLLEEPEFATLDAGIALQAYLPDCFDALMDLVEWHNGLVAEGRRRASIKIRLVKGANLAMERVEAAMRGWPQAPYPTKAETSPAAPPSRPRRPSSVPRSPRGGRSGGPRAAARTATARRSPPIRPAASSMSPTPTPRWPRTGLGPARSSPGIGAGRPPRPPAMSPAWIGSSRLSPSSRRAGPPGRPPSAGTCCGGWRTS